VDSDVDLDPKGAGTFGPVPNPDQRWEFISFKYHEKSIEK
jgi:hypothetical protein